MHRKVILFSALAGMLITAAAQGGTIMAKSRPKEWDLDTPLFYLSENKADAYKLVDAFRHNLVLGETGSGKSSTTSRVLLSSMARLGFGGLLTCVKVTDFQDYLSVLRQAGREKDIIHVTLDDDIPWRINVLEYENRRSGKNVAEVLVHLVQNLLEIIERGKQGSGADPFWRQSTNKLIRYGIIVLRAAGLPISLPNLSKLAVEAPTSPAEVDDPKWRDRSFLFRCLKAGDDAAKSTTAEARDFDQAATYYLQEHARMGDVCRGSVLATFSGAISPFLTYPLRDLYQTSTNFVPEMCENGAIIILDIPILGDNKELAQLAQVMFKMMFFRAMERRDVQANPRGVFLLSDEHQHIYSSHDQVFLTTARAARVSCTLITQNVSNFYAILPGDKGRAETDSLFGNCGTKFMHMQTDYISNTWAANLIGTTRQWFQGISTALPPAVQTVFALGNTREPARITSSVNEHETHEVPMQTFHMLRSGGKRNDLNVDAVVFSGGRTWSTTGRPWMITTFRQEG